MLDGVRTCACVGVLGADGSRFADCKAGLPKANVPLLLLLLLLVSAVRLVAVIRRDFDDDGVSGASMDT